jgi:hypothetical protein
VPADRSTSRDRRGLVHRDLRTSGTFADTAAQRLPGGQRHLRPGVRTTGQAHMCFHLQRRRLSVSSAHTQQELAPRGGGGSAGSVAAAVASHTPRPVLMVRDQGLFASRQHRRRQTSWIHQTKDPTDPQRAHDAYKAHTSSGKQHRVRHQRRRSRPRNPLYPRSSHGAPPGRRRPRPGVPGPAIDHACVLPGTASQLLARPFRPNTAPCRLDRRQGVVSQARCRVRWRERRRIPVEHHPPPNGTVRPSSGEQGQ